MEKITNNLEEIVQEQLEECKKNKTIPSTEILDIVKIIMTCRLSQQIS